MSYAYFPWGLHYLWHYVLFLHFHIVKLFMLVCLSRAVNMSLLSFSSLYGVLAFSYSFFKLFKLYWCGPDMYLHFGDCTFSLHHSDFVASALVIHLFSVPLPFLTTLLHFILNSRKQISSCKNMCLYLLGAPHLLSIMVILIIISQFKWSTDSRWPIENAV